MDTATIDDSSFLVKWISHFPGVITYDNKTATHTHAAPMRPGCTYDVTIKSGVSDIAGNSLGTDYSWSFMTIPLSVTDSIRPVVDSVHPEDGATMVGVETVITAYFSEDLDPTTITTSSFYLRSGVTGTVLYTNGIATFIPDDSLIFDHEYMVTISTDVTDTAGNSLEYEYTWSFTTIPINNGVPIMPLTIGNWWIYYTQTWDTTGKLTGEWYDTVMIVKDTLIDDNYWFIDYKGRRYSHQEEGLWRYQSGNLCLLAMYPTEVGEVCYNCPQYVYPLNPQLEVLATDWQVTVDLGTFSCYRYYMSTGIYEPIVYYYYFSPGTGLILEEQFMLHGWKNWPYRIRRRGLISYNIAEN
jgi:hypothetical protein